MTRESAKAKVLDYIDNKNWGGLMVHGQWGIGKTYFIKKYCAIDEKKHIYISSFGCSSVDEIIARIHGRINKKKLICANVVDVLADVLSECGAISPLYGSLMVGGSKVIKHITKWIRRSKKKNILLEDFTLVFDDVERYTGDKNQLFGFLNSISEFPFENIKDNPKPKRFKVVCICNRDAYGDENYNAINKVFSSFIDFDEVVENEGVANIICAEFILQATGVELIDHKNDVSLIDTIEKSVRSDEKKYKNIRDLLMLLVKIKPIIELFRKNNFDEKLIDFVFSFCIQNFNLETKKIEMNENLQLNDTFPLMVLQNAVEDYTLSFINEKNSVETFVDFLVKANEFIKKDGQYSLLDFLENRMVNEDKFKECVVLLSQDLVIENYKKYWAWVLTKVFSMFIDCLISKDDLDKISDSWIKKIKSDKKIFCQSEFEKITRSVACFVKPNWENEKIIHDKVQNIWNEIYELRTEKNIDYFIKNITNCWGDDKNMWLQGFVEEIDKKFDNLSEDFMLTDKISGAFQYCIEKWHYKRMSADTMDKIYSLSKKINLLISTENYLFYNHKKRNLFVLNKTLKDLIREWETNR